MRKKILILALGLVTVVTIIGGAGALWIIQNLQEARDKFEGSFGDRSLGLPSCEGNDLFRISPVEISQLSSIVPLGNLNPSGHTFPTRHLYWDLTGEKSLLSPGKILVTSVRTQENLSVGYTDYSIYFAPCQEFTSYFFHVSTLSEKLLSAYNQGKESYGCNEYETGGSRFRNCERGVEVPLEAGEIMGTVGARGGNIFDFGAVDFRTPELAFANPARWGEDWDTFALHVVCGLDYFIPEVKEALYAKLGSWDGKPRTIDPICGEFEQDEPGTAQGVWFVEGTTETYPEDPHLALVHDNFDPRVGAFSVGTSLAKSGLTVGVYQFSPQSAGWVNRDFDEVMPDGNIYCYNAQARGENFVIIIQLTDASHLQIEKLSQASCGAGPWGFTSSVSEFER